MSLPTWLQGKNSNNGIKYGKLEDREDYQEIKEKRDAFIPSKLPTLKANEQRKKLNLTREFEPLQENFKPKTSYEKFKDANPNTPSFLKPLGYALETPYRIPFTQRLLTKASDFLGAGSYDQKGNKIDSMSTGSKVVDGLTDVGGALIGSAFTGGSGANLLTGTDKVAEYGAGKIAAKTGNKFLGTLGRGAIDAGASTAIEDLSKGRGLKQTAKDTAINAMGGAVLFGSGKIIGEIVPKIGNLLIPKTLKNQGVNEAFERTFNKKFGEYRKINIPTEKPIIEPTLKTPISGKFTVKNTALEKATAEYEDAVQTIQNHFMTNKLIPEEIPRIKSELGIDINKLADNLDTAKTTASKIGNDARLKAIAGVTELPRNIQKPFSNSIKEVASTIENNAPQIKTSQFKTNTLRNSEFLADKETQNMIDNIASQYEVKPNTETINKATRELVNDFDGVVNRIKNTQVIAGQGALNGAEDAAASGLITRELRLKAEKTGDYTELKAWIEELQPKVTNTAQSLQALKTWKDLSPEGTIFKAQQVVGEVNRAGAKTYGKNFTPTELIPDELKFINDKMTEVGKMPSETPTQIKAKEREFAKVKKVIADKVPATLADKVKALQRISLLLNPKTNVRNILGNTILNTLENTKDVVSAPLDKLVSLKTGERTTLFPSLEGLSTQSKGMIQGAKTVIGDYKQGVNTSQSVGQFDITGNRIFKNKSLDKLENLTNTALRFGDEPFYQGAYNESLRQQMKIAKISKPTETMIEKATEFAKDRTLQNNSALAEGFTKLQKSINKMTGNENLGIGTFAVPFTKTPANILDKAIDYTPIGSLKSIAQLMSKKEFNQKIFVDRIGRSVVGTAGILLGYDLAEKGLLTGKANKDKDVAALEKQTGKSSYAFKIGDTYRTFDWAQPAAIPLAIGADIFQEGKNRKDATNVAIEAFKSGGTTLFNQSLLQGIQRMFGSGGLVEGLSSTALNVPTQFLPSALKQTAQLSDKTLRDTYDSNPTKQVLNQIKSRVPGLSNTLQPKVDTLGRNIEQFQGNNNFKNVALNPGFTTKNNPTNAEKLVLNLYEETGSKVQFPRVANDTITYKESYDKNKTIKLTSKEKTDLQRYIGERTNKEYEWLYNEKQFNSKTSKDKVKQLQSLLTSIYNDGEKKILESRGIKEYEK